MANLIKILDNKGSFALTLIDGTALARQVANQHGEPAPINALLTQLLMVTALLKAAEKDSRTRLTLSLNSGGLISKMVSYAAADALKCYCDKRDGAQVERAGQALIDMPGNFTIVKEYGGGMRSTGQSALVSDDIATNLTHYYIHSEQQASLFVISAAKQNGLSYFAAAMLTLLPLAKADDDNGYDKLTNHLEKFSELANWLARGQTLTATAAKLLLGIDYKIVSEDDVTYRCDCSRQKMTAALISLGVKELKQLCQEDDAIEMNCHYCNQKYKFSAAQLEQLIEEII